MITWSKILMHFLMFLSSYTSFLLIWCFYNKRKTYLKMIQIMLFSMLLINFLKTLSFQFSYVNYEFIVWRFPCDYILLTIIFFGMMLKKDKVIKVYVLLALMAFLMILNGYQSFLSVICNVLLGICAVVFFKSLTKTFTNLQFYLIMMCLSVCIMPFKMGYFTNQAIILFWLMLMTYPLAYCLRFLKKDYCSSLFSRIS